MVYATAAYWRRAWLPAVLPAVLCYLLLLALQTGLLDAQEPFHTVWLGGLCLAVVCSALFAICRYRALLWFALAGHYLLAIQLNGPGATAIPPDPLGLSFTATGFTVLSLAAAFPTPRDRAVGWERIAFTLLNTLLFLVLALPAAEAVLPWPPSASWLSVAGLLALAAIHTAWRRRERAALAEVFLAQAGLAAAIALVLATRNRTTQPHSRAARSCGFLSASSRAWGPPLS